jgi:hypothetical protein
MIPILAIVWSAVAVPDTGEHIHPASGNRIELSLSKVPSLLEAAVLTVTVRTEEDIQDAGIQIVLPGGIMKTGGSLSWITSLEAGDSVSFSCDIYVLQKGLWSIEAYLRSKANEIVDSTSLGLRVSSAGSALLGEETETRMTLDVLLSELEATTTGSFVGGGMCWLLGGAVCIGIGAALDMSDDVGRGFILQGAYIGGTAGSVLGSAYELYREGTDTEQSSMYWWALGGAVAAAAVSATAAIYTGHLIPYFLVTVPVGAVVGYEIGKQQECDSATLW